MSLMHADLRRRERTWIPGHSLGDMNNRPAISCDASRVLMRFRRSPAPRASFGVQDRGFSLHIHGQSTPQGVATSSLQSGVIFKP